MWPASKNMNISAKDEVKSKLMACRGCLGTGRLYNMSQYGLAKAYQQLISVEMQDTTILSQHLCQLCRALLIKFVEFRERCRRAEVLLQSVTSRRLVVTLEDIATINRTFEHLTLPYNISQISIVSCSELDTQMELQESIDEKSSEDFIHDVNQEASDLHIDSNEPVKAFEEENFRPWEQGSTRQLEVQENDEEKIRECDINTDFIKPIEERNSKTKMQNSKRQVKKQVKEVKVKNVRKNEKSRVNIMFNHPDDRLKFSEKYDVDIIVMSKEDEINDIMQRKNSTKYLQARNKCNQCYRGFIHEDTLKRHIKDKHDLSMKHVCEFCHFRFNKHANLTAHYKRNHKYKFVCRACSIVSRMRHHIVQHSKIHIDKFFCKYCGQTFNTKSTSYHAHIHSQHNMELPWCRLCGDTFVCIKTHTESKHKESLVPSLELQCINCKIQFLCTTALETHTACAAQCSSLQWCLYCGEGFELDSALRAHVLALHKLKFRCEKCSRLFSHLSRLNNHILEKHSNEGYKKGKHSRNRIEPAICDICGKTMANKYQMGYHLRIHTGEKRYSCSECQKQFQTHEQLKTHVRIHTGERPFQCKYCPNTFKTHSALNRHHLVHTGERRHMCAACGKAFATAYQMKMHVRHVHMKVPLPPRRTLRRAKRAPV